MVFILDNISLERPCIFEIYAEILGIATGEKHINWCFVALVVEMLKRVRYSAKLVEKTI